MPIHSPAARSAATPELRPSPEDRTRKNFAAFERCLTVMPQMQPALTQAIGWKVRRIEGLKDLESLRWSSETLLLGVRSLARLQNIISNGNAGLMRSIHTLGIFMSTQLSRVRRLLTFLDGCLVWSEPASTVKAKLLARLQ